MKKGRGHPAPFDYISSKLQAWSLAADVAALSAPSAGPKIARKYTWKIRYYMVLWGIIIERGVTRRCANTVLN